MYGMSIRAMSRTYKESSESKWVGKALDKLQPINRLAVNTCGALAWIALVSSPLLLVAPAVFIWPTRIAVASGLMLAAWMVTCLVFGYLTLWSSYTFFLWRCLKRK